MVNYCAVSVSILTANTLGGANLTAITNVVADIIAGDKMIAVYYSYGLRGVPEGMFVVPVPDDDHDGFLKALDNHPNFPFPKSEILFIHNDVVVNTWDHVND